ncbi:MAG TPA: efflux RND transporter periplasmic adaptor subunit [Burkholderiales bacterium]|jgi:multidrug efflux system membrane fusion protein|nr:efflux RND transporter periplasmic adaptor subunit [Burkholderiales bacterium]
MTRTGRRVLLASALVVVVAGIVLAGYYTSDFRAKEARKAPKGPPAVPVTVAPVMQQAVPIRVAAIGNVEAFLTVAVKARVDGQIVTVNFREGQSVKKDEVLFRIDPRPYEAVLRQAEANALRDRAARDQARSQAKRYQELLDKNFISKEAYAQIRTNAETAEATAKASQAALENARLNLEYCTIYSPLEGYAGKVLLQAGNMVRANDVNPLVVINQVRPIYVNFAVPEQNLPDVRKYQSQSPLRVDVVSPDPATQSVTGQLIFIDNAVDPSTGTIRLRAQFENADATLWPGQFVNVLVQLYEKSDAIVIPSAALQTGPEGQYVYIIGEDSLAEVRKINVERTEGDRAIVSGLKQGERVVTRGQLRLGPKTRVQIAKPAAAPS